MKLGLVSLGCDKNTVDSERMLATLVGHGATRVADLREAEVVLVNTCGFIDAAKEESIETLLEAAELKEEGRCQAVVAVGCMVERYRDEMKASLPEVDLFLGLRELDRLVPELQARGLLRPGGRLHPGERLALGSRHVAYLKVSEGCNHGCAFCAIPSWRGRHRSFPIDRLVAEAQRLELQGTVELNLVAQDLAHFGRDLGRDADITALVERLLSETSIPWIRLLYIYSAGLRRPLVELMAREDRLLSYIDMPIQHASDPVLERMRRPERRETLRHRIGWLRDTIPDLTLRTTVMVGFPGETDADYRALIDFMEEIEFDRLGAFAFSPQPGTAAAAMSDDYVPESVAADRLEELLEVQRAISAERMAGEVGRRRLALVDRRAAPDDRPPRDGAVPDGSTANGESSAGSSGPGDAARNGPGGRWLGRLASQADDVDGVTHLASSTRLEAGRFVEIEVTAAGDFDLAAEVTEVQPPARRTVRTLPLAPLGLETAWGK